MDPAFWLLEPAIHRKAHCSRNVSTAVGILAGAVDDRYSCVFPALPDPVRLRQQVGTCITLLRAWSHRDLLRGLFHRPPDVRSGQSEPTTGRGSVEGTPPFRRSGLQV